MARYTRRLTPIVGDERRRKRACHDRTQTVMKKGDELAVLCPGTKVWVIVQNGEQTCMYSSEEASSPPVFSASDNVIITGPGDYRTHNEVMATGLNSTVLHTPPQSLDPVTPPLHSQTSSPPNLTISQSAKFHKGVRPAFFREQTDLTHNNGEGLEKAAKPKRFTHGIINRRSLSPSNPKRNSRIKPESHSRPFMRDIPEWRSRERSSSGSRSYI